MSRLEKFVLMCYIVGVHLTLKAVGNGHPAAIPLMIVTVLFGIWFLSMGDKEGQ